MSMFKDIQSFRDQARAIAESGSQHVGRDILALALEGRSGQPHPGAYPHIVVEVLEQSGALADRDRLKQALAEPKANPLTALKAVYAQA